MASVIEPTLAHERALTALARLPTEQTADVPASVRSIAIFGRASARLSLPLNRKTTQQAIVPFPVDKIERLEPRLETIPVAGLKAYIQRPRRDPADVAHIVRADGSERWVIQEGHTRLGAAVLRKDQTLPVRVWEFTQDGPTGDIVPVIRGRHRIGTGFRERLKKLAADPMSTLHPDWQRGYEGQDGLVRTFRFPNHRACASFLEELMYEANRVNHHPDLGVSNCAVTVTYVTHASGDTVTEKDYDGAALADRLFETTPEMALTLGWDEADHPRDEFGRFAGSGGEARAFKGNEGYDWHERPEMEAYVKELPYDKANAISSYASFGYGDVNRLMRGEFKPSDVSEVVRQAAPEEVKSLKDFQVTESYIKEHGHPFGRNDKPGTPDDPRGRVLDADGKYVGHVLHVPYTPWDDDKNFRVEKSVPDIKRVEELKSQAATIDSAIRDHGYKLEEPIKVNRAAYIPGMSFDSLKEMEGKTIVEKGFTSTMVGDPGNRLDGYVVIGKTESIYKRHNGKEGAIYQHQDEVGAAMRLEIVLPKGTKVAPVEGIRRAEYEFPRIPDPSVKDHPEWLKNDDGTPNGMKESDFTIRDYSAKPTIKTTMFKEKDKRSESEILLGSGAQFRIVNVRRGEKRIVSSDPKLRPVDVIDVQMEYVGGGSSEGD